MTHVDASWRAGSPENRPVTHKYVTNSLFSFLPFGRRDGALRRGRRLLLVAGASQAAPETMHTRGTLTLVLLASVSSRQLGRCLAHRHWFGTSTPTPPSSVGWFSTDLKHRHIRCRQPWPSQRCPCATATLHGQATMHGRPCLRPWSSHSELCMQQ